MPKVPELPPAPATRCVAETDAKPANVATDPKPAPSIDAVIVVMSDGRSLALRNDTLRPGPRIPANYGEKESPIAYAAFDLLSKRRVAFFVRDIVRIEIDDKVASAQTRAAFGAMLASVMKVDDSTPVEV